MLPRYTSASSEGYPRSTNLANPSEMRFFRHANQNPVDAFDEANPSHRSRVVLDSVIILRRFSRCENCESRTNEREELDVTGRESRKVEWQRSRGRPTRSTSVNTKRKECKARAAECTRLNIRKIGRKEKGNAEHTSVLIKINAEVTLRPPRRGGRDGFACPRALLTASRAPRLSVF